MAILASIIGAIILFLVGLEFVLGASNMALDSESKTYEEEKKNAKAQLYIGIGFIVFAVVVIVTVTHIG